MSEDYARYIAEHTVAEDDFLRTLKREAIAAGLPPIWIASEQGSLMQILLRLIGAREVIEVGTLAGYSAIWMARALPAGGHVHTIEISGKHADFAERWVGKADVAEKIKIYRGAGKDVLPKFKAGSADAIFIDADKPGYPLYLRHGLRLVRAGGLIMADNAFAFGELFENNPEREEVDAIRAFNEIMAHEAGLQSLIVPIGDGLWVAVRL
ncbi:MAG: O-methyltransferase [Acidobacteriia bacterium]|nr:O-methyltransferase [Terriglobia bacterium]